MKEKEIKLNRRKNIRTQHALETPRKIYIPPEILEIALLGCGLWKWKTKRAQRP